MVRLIEISALKPEWQTVHRIRALEVNRSAPVLQAIARLRLEKPAEFKKLLVVLRLVGSTDRVRNPGRVKKAKGFDGIYEMRAGQLRLFFFYTPDAEEVVICTNSYWKAKPSQREQNDAFSRCDRLRALYLSSKGDV